MHCRTAGGHWTMDGGKRWPAVISEAGNVTAVGYNNPNGHLGNIIIICKNDINNIVYNDKIITLIIYYIVKILIVIL